MMRVYKAKEGNGGCGGLDASTQTTWHWSQQKTRDQLYYIYSHLAYASLWCEILPSCGSNRDWEFHRGLGRVGSTKSVLINRQAFDSGFWPVLCGSLIIWHPKLNSWEKSGSCKCQFSGPSQNLFGTIRLNWTAPAHRNSFYVNKKLKDTVHNVSGLLLIWRTLFHLFSTKEWHNLTSEPHEHDDYSLFLI